MSDQAQQTVTRSAGANGAPQSQPRDQATPQRLLGDLMRDAALHPFLLSLFAMLLAAGVVSTLHGCATARDFAQGVVSSGAVVLDETDAIAAEAYRDAARAALADSQTLAQYLERMEPYDQLVVALEGAADVLRALQSLVDVWDAGAQGRWSEAAHEALTAFEAVFRAFRSVGATPPASLFEFLGTVVDLPEP